MDCMLEGVAGTALGVAMIRAAETAREDRLFTDHLAQVFVDLADGSLPDIESLDDTGREVFARMYAWIVARTLFLDDICAEAISNGVSQIVILGAGLDARGYRLDWPNSVDLFEVDRSDIFAFKDSALESAGAKPTCRRHTVDVDLRDEWPIPLQQAGFDPKRPTMWLAEGLISYLRTEDIERLLTLVTELSSPGSRLGVTLHQLASTPPPDPSNDLLAGVRALWQPVGDLDPADWLAVHGWTSRLAHADDVLAAAGRSDTATATESEPPRLLHAVRK